MGWPKGSHPTGREARRAARQSQRQARLGARVVRVAQQRWAGEHDDDGEKPLRVVACSSVRQRRTAVDIDVALELQDGQPRRPADERATSVPAEPLGQADQAANPGRCCSAGASLAASHPAEVDV